MKILIDGRPLLEKQRCGVGTYALEMVKALAVTERHDLTMWSSGLKSSWPQELPKDKIRCVLSKLPNKLVNAGFSFLEKPCIEDYSGGTDVDFVYLPNLNFIATKLPYIVTVHDLSFIHFPEFFPPKGRAWHRAIKLERLIKNAAHVITVSEHTKTDLQELFDVSATKISIVPPGVGPEFKPLGHDQTQDVRTRHKLPDKYFLFVGAIEPRKNIEGLIAAFERVSGSEELVIAGGKGWLNRHVYDRAAASTRRNQIHFLGFIPPEDKPALYSGATALVYPSFYEGFGMPPVEAMASGTPVIASQVSSLPEVVGRAGLLVNPHDVNSIATAMRSLADDGAAQENFRLRGLERAENFSWSRSAQKLIDTLNNLRT